MKRRKERGEKDREMEKKRRNEKKIKGGEGERKKGKREQGRE